MAIRGMPGHPGSPGPWTPAFFGAQQFPPFKTQLPPFFFLGEGDFTTGKETKGTSAIKTADLRRSPACRHGLAVLHC
jgi:hypothetical protein